MQFFLVPEGHKLHAGSTATPHSRRTYSVESFVRDERRVALGRVTPTAGSAEHVPEHVAEAKPPFDRANSLHCAR
jgi:hypothetical protein